MPSGEARAPGEGYRRSLVLGLFVVSGACDLVCEIAWSRALGLVFGVTVFAVSTVLAVFMMGLAAGGLVASHLVRWARKTPMTLFVRVHVAISLATAATLLLLPAARGLYVGASSYVPAWALQPIAVLLSMFVLIVPATLMGATLPAASALFARGSDTAARDVGSLYAASTLGSVLGAIATAFLLLPRAGTRETIAIAALVDLLIAVVAIAAGSGSAGRAGSVDSASGAPAGTSGGTAGS